MEAAITDVPLEGVELEKVPKLTVLPATVPQIVPVIDVPVQNVNASSIVPLRLITWLVLAATTPLSTCVVKSSPEYVNIRTKNVSLVVVGLVTVANVATTGPVTAAADALFLTRKYPAALSSAQLAWPEPLYVNDVNADPAFVHDPGIVHAPDAAEQTWNVIPLSAVASVGVNVNVHVAAVLPADVLTASFRAVICPAALAFEDTLAAPQTERVAPLQAILLWLVFLVFL